MSEQSKDILIQAGEMEESGANVLDSTYEFIGRFCVLEDTHCQVAIALWAAMTHAIEYFYIAPRLLLLSPEKESGKTRVLEVLNLITPEPMLIFSPSTASIFRLLAEKQITLLFDEGDAVWKGGGKDDMQEDLRALLNAGYKRGAEIPRCVGKNYEVKLFKVFCAVAMAGIKSPPDTILSRSLIINMQRRTPNEPIEPYRGRKHDSQGHALRERLSTWVLKIGQTVGDAWPDLPEGIVDRCAEIWEPLIAIADEAGGDWPDLSRKACLHLSNRAQDQDLSNGIRLLSDLKILFGDSRALSTAYILDMLVSEHSGIDDDAPWGDICGGKAIDSRKLARLLKPYGVKSTKVKIDTVPLQGYRRDDLWNAWERWLPPLPRSEAEPTEPMEPDCVVMPFKGSVVPDSEQKVPDNQDSLNGPEPAQSLDSSKKVPQVPQVPHFQGVEGEQEKDSREVKV